MFGLAWTEIGVIGVVAMILIGPKDMPVAIKAVSDMVKKARRMAGEFQGHVDEMLRDSNLAEVRDSINEIRGMDIAGTIRRAVDEDGSVQKAFGEDPFKVVTTGPRLEEPAGVATTDAAVAFAPPPAPSPLPPLHSDAPAFIPPALVPPPLGSVPAFIPPEAARTPLRPGA